MITARDSIQKAEFFDEEENWGNLDMVHYRLIEVLDVYRKFLGSRIHLSPTESAHAEVDKKEHPPKSWHYAIPGRNKFSRAVKVFPECDLYEAFIMALRFQFTGIIIWPYAENIDMGTSRDDTSRGALTLDLRTAPNFRVIQYVDKNGKYNYVNNVNDFDELLKIIKSTL